MAVDYSRTAYIRAVPWQDMTGWITEEDHLNCHIVGLDWDVWKVFGLHEPWMQKVSGTYLSHAEICMLGEAKAIGVRQQRYRDEADPLFFQWQRGEIEQQVWLDKVEQIRQEVPKPVVTELPNVVNP